MEVRLTPDLEAQLEKLASESGRSKDELLQDAVAGYCAELSQVREMLDGRYDEIKNGQVKPLDGEDAFARLREKSKEHRSNRT